MARSTQGAGIVGAIARAVGEPAGDAINELVRHAVYEPVGDAARNLVNDSVRKLVGDAVLHDHGRRGEHVKAWRAASNAGRAMAETSSSV